MKTRINSVCLNRGSILAFTRVDLMAVLVITILLAVPFIFYRSGERGRVARCTRNLQVLGGAMQNFANDHASALPPAGVEASVTGWNLELAPYLQPGSASVEAGRSNSISPGAQKQLGLAEKAITAAFECPSDAVKRDNPRSYAMSTFDMVPENWPPGPENETGVGLVWSKANVSRLLGDNINNLPPTDRTEALAWVKSFWIPEPANTLLLTELFHADNRLNRWGQVVTKAKVQETAIGSDAGHAHKGRFNYLMLDGHVELLTPAQTGAWGGSAGIWTIRAGD